jgi:hypothetical protein
MMSVLVLNWINSLNPLAHAVLVVLGSLVVLATTYVQVIPSPKAEGFIAKLEATPVVGDFINALMTFSVIQRKQ